jgi:hypothetical protein
MHQKASESGFGCRSGFTSSSTSASTIAGRNGVHRLTTGSGYLSHGRDARAMKGARTGDQVGGKAVGRRAAAHRGAGSAGRLGHLSVGG